MTNQSGPVVFTITPAMAQGVKPFRVGDTWVAHKATTVALGEAVAPRVTTQKAAKKTAAKKKKTAAKKASKPKVTKKVTKKTSKPKVTKKQSTRQEKVSKANPAVAKSTKRKPVRPDLIIGFVRKNEGCNMTDIEGHTKLPQGTIRRILNSARENGDIRTEGQRRGLRYYAGSEAATATASTDVVSADN